MGDVPPDGGIVPGHGHLPADLSHDDSQISAAQFPSSQQSSIPSRLGGNQPFSNQFSSVPSLQQRGDSLRTPLHYGQPPYNPQQLGQQQQPQPGSSFNMGGMAGALPDYSSGIVESQFQSGRQPQPQRRLSVASTPAVVYQLQQNLQYPPSAGASGFSNQGSYSGFNQGQYQTGYGQQQNQQGGFNQFPGGQPRLNITPQQTPQFQQMSTQYYYYPGGYAGQTPQSSFGTQFLGGFVRGGGQGSAGGLSPPDHLPGSVESLAGQSSATDFQGTQRQVSDAVLSPIPRGPPRKPKQSGHALWVGNLPPGATIMDLKDHFSRDATRDIESLFLISKSNCAFVNYRTEAACAAAMQRFHDSRFQGVRLVCRLRRSSAPSPGVPTGPSAMSGGRPSQSLTASKSPPISPKKAEEEEAPLEEAPTSQAPEAAEGDPSEKVPDKFFIIKSLTLQDLEQSVRNGIWATQSHNEKMLNKAYETADNVYLIFSANKSGEYFGYARMTSPILDDSAEVYRQMPRTDATPEPANAPRTIPTTATETAPKGRIVDDSARGTIFWEAELTDEEEEEPTAAGDDSSADPIKEPDPSSQAWGKPFRVEWLSTVRLPFYRTRGLRNPWNANREVKIARDGTQLEPSVGKRLVQMFHRTDPPAAGVGLNPAQMQIPPYGGGMPGSS